jgi:hypothetical protein
MLAYFAKVIKFLIALTTVVKAIHILRTSFTPSCIIKLQWPPCEYKSAGFHAGVFCCRADLQRLALTTGANFINTFVDAICAQAYQASVQIKLFSL